MKWKIGNVEIPNQVVVAPMAGVTNSAFRVICKRFGAGYVVCEMISDRGIMYHNQRTLNMMDVDPEEHPMGIQIFGGTKETLVEAAKYVDQHTAADVIDINMGCPVNKVVKTDAGARWLLDPNKVYEMVSYVTDAVKKPVTVKMRTGWDDKHILAVENALAAERAGASAIAMHGRTRKQMYTGQADWNILKEVASQLKIPFMANGDVKTPEDAKKILDILLMRYTHFHIIQITMKQHISFQPSSCFRIFLHLLERNLFMKHSSISYMRLTHLCRTKVLL